MKGFVVLLLVLGVAHGLNSAAVANFADNNWNCVTAACTSRVSAGTFQSQYQCAEFVSRSLAAAGVFPGLTATSSQSAFLNYKYSNGKTYDLLWVSSVQGLPLGMEDLLKVMGWTNIGTDCNKVKAGYVGITVGSDGPHSHTYIGVGEKLADAHNSARFHVSSCFFGTTNAIYAPPGNGAPPPAPPAGCKGVYTVNGDVNLRDAASLTGNIVAVMNDGSTVFDLDGTTTASGGYNWRHIKYNDQTGYAADSLLTRTGPCATPKTFCATAQPNLRLRNGACTTAGQLTVVPNGASVTSLSDTLVTGCGYTWRNVDFNGIQGWAANAFLTPCTPLGKYEVVNGTAEWPLDPGSCSNPVPPDSGATGLFAGILSLALLVFNLF